MTNSVFSAIFTNILGAPFIAFDFGYRPAVLIFGFPIYFYALAIVTGMCLAILIGGLYFKKRGYDPYDITIYALVIIPLGVLGARLYVYIFPWSGRAADWSTFFDFRGGGLGIYGGVILGYIAAFATSKIRKQDFRIVVDCIMPGLFLAQSLGRWGNFANQEAYGQLITSDFLAMPNFMPSSDHGFNFIAVWIDHSHGSSGAGWYQATFFYESVCTFIGFLVCVTVLMRSKHYKLGWCSAFYGIYYGIVRLVIEYFRSDSLYLYVGTKETDIKISMLVSVITIILGLWMLSRIYRKQLHNLYSKLFKSEVQELALSRWVLLAVSVLTFALAVTMFALGGESKFIVGVVALVVSVYSALGIWALCDRLKLYCKSCGKRNMPVSGWQTDHDKYFAATVCYTFAATFFLFLALLGLVKMGIVDKVDNGYVLAVAATVCLALVVAFRLVPSYRKLFATKQTRFDGTAKCQCGSYNVKLNSFLLFLFPPKVYADYGVENLTPWVDPESQAKKDKKSKKKAETVEKAAEQAEATPQVVEEAVEAAVEPKDNQDVAEQAEVDLAKQQTEPSEDIEVVPQTDASQEE